MSCCCLLLLPLRSASEQLVVFAPHPQRAAVCLAVPVGSASVQIVGQRSDAESIARVALSAFPSVRPSREWCDDMSSEAEEVKMEAAECSAAVGSLGLDSILTAVLGAGDDELTRRVPPDVLRSMRGDRADEAFEYILASGAVAFTCSTAAIGDGRKALSVPAWRVLAVGGSAEAGASAPVPASGFTQATIDSEMATLITLGAAAPTFFPDDDPHYAPRGRTPSEAVDFIRRRFASGSKTELLLPEDDSPTRVVSSLRDLVQRAFVESSCGADNTGGPKGSALEMSSAEPFAHFDTMLVRTGRLRCGGPARFVPLTPALALKDEGSSCCSVA